MCSVPVWDMTTWGLNAASPECLLDSHQNWRVRFWASMKVMIELLIVGELSRLFTAFDALHCAKHAKRRAIIQRSRAYAFGKQVHFVLMAWTSRLHSTNHSNVFLVYVTSDVRTQDFVNGLFLTKRCRLHLFSLGERPDILCYTCASCSALELCVNSIAKVTPVFKYCKNGLCSA